MVHTRCSVQICSGRLLCVAGGAIKRGFSNAGMASATLIVDSRRSKMVHYRAAIPIWTLCGMTCCTVKGGRGDILNPGMTLTTLVVGSRLGLVVHRGATVFTDNLCRVAGVTRGIRWHQQCPARSILVAVKATEAVVQSVMMQVGW